MLKRIMAGAVVGMTLAVGYAQAETMAVKAEWDKVNTENKGYLDTLNTTCGTQIKLDLNKASFKTRDEISNFFWSATEGIGAVCSKGDDQKKTIASKIKTIKMSFGAEKYSVKEGVFNYSTDLGKTNGNSSGNRDKITEWVENNL